MAGLAIIYLAYREHAGMLFLDGSGKPRLIDFAAFWAAAKHVLAGDAAQVYNGAHLVSYEVEQLGQPPVHNLVFPYPPTALLFVWPLGLFGYLQACIAMQLAGGVTWFVVLRSIVRDTLTALGMALALGASTYSITLGQNGFFTASLLCGGLSLLDRSKPSSGVLLGLLTFKPHLAAVACVALLFWREWRALSWAGATAAMMVLAATVVFGFSIWADFIAGNAEFARQFSGGLHGVVAILMQSPFAYVAPRWGVLIALGFQLLIAVLALAFVIVAKGRDNCAAAVIAATLVVTPFSFNYDFTALVGAAAFLLRSSRNKIEANLICGLAFIPSLFLALGGQIALVAALGFLVLTFYRSRQNLAPQMVG